MKVDLHAPVGFVTLKSGTMVKNTAGKVLPIARIVDRGGANATDKAVAAAKQPVFQAILTHDDGRVETAWYDADLNLILTG